MEDNFHRIGSINNTHVGREFEEAARLFIVETGVHLRPNLLALVGHSIKKPHRFDLGSDDPPILRIEFGSRLLPN